MLIVNTIEFGGEKAVINSYSHAPELQESIRRQLAEWSAKYPGAVVRTEEMPTSRVLELVALGRERSGFGYAYTIGESSLRTEEQAR